LQAAIVDLDGTLIDTVGDFAVALNSMLQTLDLPAVDRAFIERTVGKGSEHLIRTTLAASGAFGPGADALQALESASGHALFERGFALYQDAYLGINGQHAAVYAGAVEGLQALKRRGLRLACLTNKPTAFAQPLLRSKGLAEYFDVVFGGDAFERKKPDPLPLLRTCEALRTTPSHTLMVGDSSNDAQAAHAAGCPVALVTYGYNHGEPIRSVAADAYIDRLDALDALWG
jgi:phosphoglycolate phosphatase